MKQQNIIQTTKEPSFKCPQCDSKNTYKQGVSNWHDESGIYYMKCTDCDREWNERWYGEDYKGNKE